MNSLPGKEITKSYGGKTVLHQLDLELEPGKIYGLIGSKRRTKDAALDFSPGHSAGGGYSSDRRTIRNHKVAIRK